MAAFALTQVHIAANELLMAPFANQVEINAESDAVDVTTFSSGGYKQSITGLGMFSVNISGFQDFVAPAPGTVFPASTTTDGALSTFTVSAPGDTVGNVAYFGTARVMSITELSGAVGEAAGFAVNMTGNNRLVRGQMLHPSAARTATGNGTATAFTTPLATQSLHAAFHVHSVTGSGTITFTVQTDDNSGMTTPVTRITSTGFTAVGHEFKSLAGALAGETHIRVVYTISGFTSVTFSVAAGVGIA